MRWALFSFLAGIVAKQVPLAGPAVTKQWTEPPTGDETAHLVFNSLHSLLQHWPNTLWRNGHTLVPGYLTPGTLLYHGTGYKLDGPPDYPEWASFDPEHSAMFGSRMYTFAVGSKPLKILYFDGSSASNMDSGTIDMEEILLNGKLSPNGWANEWVRILEMCKWGEQYDIKGYVRMEFDFEIMVCDFADGMELVSGIDLVPVNRTRPPIGRPPPERFQHPRLNVDLSSLNEEPPQRPPRPPRGPWVPTLPPVGWTGSLRQANSMLFEAIHAGNWHNHAPGVGGVDLDLASAISFFDPKWSSLVKARRGITRHRYRMGNISESDVQIFREDLEIVLSRRKHSGSGVNWTTLARGLVDRFADRLEFLRDVLDDATSSTPHLEAAIGVSVVRTAAMTILTPYMINTTIPPTASSPDSHVRFSNTTWLDETMRLCSGAFTSRLDTATMTPQELLLRDSVEAVTAEICRTVGVVWVDAFPAERLSDTQQKVLLRKWHVEIRRLMDWLGWALWVKCRPACKAWEMCSLPQWPFDFRWGQSNDDYTPKCMDRIKQNVTFGMPGRPEGRPSTTPSLPPEDSEQLCNTDISGIYGLLDD